MERITNNSLVTVLSIASLLIGGTQFAQTYSPGKLSSEKEQTQFTNPDSYRDLRGNGMCFTENKGQVVDTRGGICPDVLYTGNSSGANIYLRKTGISYVQNNMGEVIREVNEQAEEFEKTGEITAANEQGKKRELIQKQIIKLHRTDVDFINCSANTATQTAERVEGYANYYLAHCPNGIMQVNSYNRITFKNIYPNIDVIYYGGKERGLKYDIVVNPGGDPGNIKLKYSGADEIKIINDEPACRNGGQATAGRLIIKNSFSEIKEQLPKVYQNINGKIADVKTAYRLEHLSNNEVIVHFSFSTFNSSYPMVVDPWVTYLGGSDNDMGYGLTTDTNGDILVAGETYGPAFPVSPGAHQTTYVYGEAFAGKFNAAGIRLWTTYYGGSDNEGAFAIATDKNNDVVITGWVRSSNFPVTGGCFQTATSGMDDTFIVKFNSLGMRLWATYCGGSDYDYGHGIATDGSANIIVTGWTQSVNFPIMGFFQGSKGGGRDAFIIKFNSTGTRQWATYYGGNAEDLGVGIATDVSDNIFITGSTNSPNFPVINAYKPISSGNGSSFAVKFDKNGNRMWATFGPLGNNYTGGITIDLSGSVIFTGGGIFVVKLNNAGALIWIKVLGGSAGEEGAGVAIDNNNNIYLTGDTYSADFPVSPCAYQKALGVPEDNYLIKLDPNGNIICSTFLGGSGSSDDEIIGGGNISIHNNFVYITGWAAPGYPVTPGAFQTNFGGGQYDAFIAQLCINGCGISNPVTPAFSANNATICINNSVNFTNLSMACDTTNTTWKWYFTDGIPATSNVRNPSGIIYNTIGSHSVKLVVTSPCGTDSITKTALITVNNCGCTLSAKFTKGTATCTGCGCKEWIMIDAIGGTKPYSYTWSDGYNRRYLNHLCPGTYSINIKDKNGCSINLNLTAP